MQQGGTGQAAQGIGGFRGGANRVDDDAQFVGGVPPPGLPGAHHPIAAVDVEAEPPVGVGGGEHGPYPLAHLLQDRVHGADHDRVADAGDGDTATTHPAGALQFHAIAVGRDEAAAPHRHLAFPRRLETDPPQVQVAAGTR